jgi:hypothetical protein
MARLADDAGGTEKLTQEEINAANQGCTKSIWC